MSGHEHNQPQNQHQSEQHVDQPMTGHRQQPLIGQHQQPIVDQSQQPMAVPYQQPMAVPYQQPRAVPYQYPMSGSNQQAMPGPYQQPMVVPYQQPMVGPYQQPMVGPYQQPMVVPYQQPMVGPYQQPMVVPYQQPMVPQYQQPMVGQHQLQGQQQPIMQGQSMKQEFKQPMQRVEPTKWNTEAPQFIPRSALSETQVSYDAENNSDDSVEKEENQKDFGHVPQNASLGASAVEPVFSKGSGNHRQESTIMIGSEGNGDKVKMSTPSVKKESTPRLQDAISLRANDIAGPSSSASPEPYRATGSNRVQKISDSHLPNDSEPHEIHLNARVVDDQNKKADFVDNVNRKLGTVTIEEDSRSVVSTTSTQMRIESSAFEGHLKDEKVFQNHSSTIEPVEVSDESVAYQTQHNPGQQVVDTEGFQLSRNSLSSQSPFSLRQEQEPFEALKPSVAQDLSVAHDPSAAQVTSKKTLLKEQRALKLKKRRERKAEQLAKDRKAEEEDEAALSEAIAFNEGFQGKEERLRVTLKKYQKDQNNIRMLFQINNNTLPETIELPWIIQDILFYSIHFELEEGMKEEVLEFLNERLEHWKSVTTLAEEEHHRWISIYKVLIELQDNVVLQDFISLKKMFRWYPDYTEYLESELISAIFAGDAKQNLVPKITLRTETPFPKLEEYLEKHAIRRYSGERNDGKLGPGDVKLIIAFKKAPWSSISIIWSRTIFWRRYVLYRSDPERTRNKTLRWLSDAFQLLSSIPSPILAFDATQLHETPNRDEDIAFIKLLMGPVEDRISQ